MEEEDKDRTRVMKNHPMPPRKPLDSEEIFSKGTINWSLVRSFLKR